MASPLPGKFIGQRNARIPRERVFELERLLTQCVPHPQIKRYCAAKWGITEHTVEGYIREVYRRWGAMPSLDREGRKEQMRQTLNDFYQSARKAGAYSAAATALDRMCKLDGLYAPEKVEVGVGASTAVTETAPDKIRDRIRELYTRNFGTLPDGTVVNAEGVKTGAGDGTGEGSGTPTTH